MCSITETWMLMVVPRHVMGIKFDEYVGANICTTDFCGYPVVSSPLYIHSITR